MSWGLKPGGGHGRPGTRTQAGVQAGMDTGERNHDIDGRCKPPNVDAATL
jgi:hypothetical protein